jgi:hypothetical protein
LIHRVEKKIAWTFIKGYGKRQGASNLKVQNAKRKAQNNSQQLAKFEALNPKF